MGMTSKQMNLDAFDELNKEPCKVFATEKQDAYLSRIFIGLDLTVA